MSPATFLEIECTCVRFPAECACCGGSVAAVEKLPIIRGVDVIVGSFTRSLELDLPTCETCHRTLLKRRTLWWLEVIALAMAAPIAALAGLISIELTHKGFWHSAGLLAAVAWLVGGLWWLRNRAGQAYTRRYLPAWIEDATDSLALLSVGFRRESFARKVAVLSGIEPAEAIPNDGAGYRDAASRMPEAYLPAAPQPLAWWWYAVLGVGMIAAAYFEFVDLAEHERAHRPVSMHVLMIPVYRIFGKVGVAGLLGSIGVAGLAVSVSMRRRQRSGHAPE